MMNKKRQSVCIIAAHVVVMHAAALTLMVSSSPVQPTVHHAPKRMVASVMHTRLAPPQATTPPAVRPTISSFEEPPVPVAQASAEVPQPPADTMEPAAAPTEDQTVASTEEASPAAIAEPGDNYFPRPLLSMPPKSSAPVIVPFPEEIKEPGRYTTILALFIDENGVVRRVRIDGPSLPKPLEDAARDSFLQAHFRPGEVQGQQVKSLIRVEVVFDNTPIEPQSTPQSL